VSKAKALAAQQGATDLIQKQNDPELAAEIYQGDLMVYWLATERRFMLE